jgi:hypothetical protein
VKTSNLTPLPLPAVASRRYTDWTVPAPRVYYYVSELCRKKKSSKNHRSLLIYATGQSDMYHAWKMLNRTQYGHKETVLYCVTVQRARAHTLTHIYSTKLDKTNLSLSWREVPNLKTPK